ncbi:helix-turn-helix domain-containing protein [uncultured Lactobacillus sp.]|uniref:helix-turn-helix domain-containing protein n=1 Tax=uncultured Lactobacillus sp. TaxID=153152 RepID=UPI002614BCBB|nr:helix-turn-helix transcriptional regulator [uncultured Lactobacillus sp.]
MTTFERIKKLSKKLDKNLQEVAIEAGLGKNAIYKWQTQNPKAIDLAEVAKVLNTTTDYLLGNIDDPSIPDKKQTITDADLDEMLDNARSFDGKPMTPHDRDLIRAYLKGLYDNK